ncbi:zinc finger and BTB domain-containing protein 41-like [Phymastichus coffea]|uniref:zinc finger and BTB domain-containing protein 41-like n=1 Tax=Phymastichus coffea TaxID=108790 RepID=UPI00273BA2A7|nr:zinc finger and BTB domain-containing protein 41-like [Phymastichus coffea]
MERDTNVPFAIKGIRKILRNKIKRCNPESNNELINHAISIKNISNNQRNNDKLYSEQITEDFLIQEVRHIKEEVIDVNESSNHEMSEYSDYDNIMYVDDKSANEFFFTESINVDAPCEDKTKSHNEAEQLHDLIVFTCTKCRKTTNNPEYFVKKTDLQCSDCQATMKFQCPRCKLMFRNFDNAVRHAKQSCPIGESTSLSPMLLIETKDNVHKCSACGYRSASTLDFRRHIRFAHPNDDSAYACSRCSRNYKSRDSMMKHLRLCGREPHIVCVFCGYKTKRREHLRVHMRHKHPDPESCHGGGYDCPNCNKKYKYLMPLKSHLKICGMKKAEIDNLAKSTQGKEAEETTNTTKETE